MTYVTFDSENGDLALKLPKAFLRFQDALYIKLTEQFVGADFDEQTLMAMNQYVETWLRGQGGKK